MVFCGRCGAPNPDWNLYCNSCGSSIRSAYPDFSDVNPTAAEKMDYGASESTRKNKIIKRIEIVMMLLGILVTFFGGFAENLTFILIGSVVIALSLVLPGPLVNLFRGLGK